MKIKYNTPIEVSEKSYNILMRNFGGIVCGRISRDKYFIKVWVMRYANIINKILNQ